MNFHFLRYVDEETCIKITLDGGVDVVGKLSLVEVVIPKVLRVMKYVKKQGLLALQM